MNLVKTISTQYDSLRRRVVKFLRFGLNDVQTSMEAGPYGIDSNPVKDMIAVYSPTGEKGKTVVIGYINVGQKADVGELRLFSTDSEGAEKFYAWLKADGTMEIGGATKNLVRYQELETGFNQLKADFNNLVTAYNLHTHVASSFGTPTTTPASVGVQSSATIAGAKIEEIKTL